MISRDVHAGVPRPVGTKYLQRDLWAGSPRGEGDCLWTVSLVRTIGGDTIEAKPIHRAPIVASDLRHHSSIYEDVLKQIRALLDSDDGWKVRTVAACKVKGCDNGAPLWLKRGQDECASCAVRTVVACMECGQPDKAGYVNRESLLARQLCFRCDLWRQRIEDPPEVVSHADPPVVYGIGNGTGPASCKGFGGRKWRVTFDSGRVVDTDDLWCGGEVPEWFRSRIPSNARVEPRPITESAREAEQ